MFDRISFAIFVRYAFDPDTERIYGVYFTEEDAARNMGHCQTYAEACEKDPACVGAPVYRLARVRVTELDEEPTAYAPAADDETCECGHSREDHHFGHPSGQSPCVKDGTAAFGAYADECMKFRPAPSDANGYNAHAPLS